MEKALLLLTMIFTLFLEACDPIEYGTTTLSTEETEDTRADSCTAFTVEISDRIEQITGIYIPCLAYSSEFTADGFCHNWFVYVESIDDFPELGQTDTMNIIRNFSLR